MAEAVVERRARVLPPPVAADDAAVPVADAWIRSDAVHDRLEREGAGGGGLVSFALRFQDTVSPQVGRPGPVDADPALAGFSPEAQRAFRRAPRGRDDGDQLCRRLSGSELVCQVRWARERTLSSWARRRSRARKHARRECDSPT